jgi:uncharacterized protein YfaA (DUF2138 family)
MNRTVLGSIWSGEITTWDHPAIQELNPDIADKLPSASIIVGYLDSNLTLSFVEVLKETLESFSPDFRAVFAVAGRTFANLPPALNGTMVPVSGSTTARAAWMMVCPGP